MGWAGRMWPLWLPGSGLAGQRSTTHPLRPAPYLHLLSFSGTGNTPYSVLESHPLKSVFILLFFLCHSGLNYAILGCQGTSMITRFNYFTNIWYFLSSSSLVGPFTAISLPAIYTNLNCSRLTYLIIYLYLAKQRVLAPFIGFRRRSSR